MGRNNEYETKRLNGIYNRFFKRVLDIVCSFLAITVFSVIYIPICIIIKCTSEGPIFFKQKRVGKDKSYFNILKFRTMRIDTPKDCPTHLLENPDRYITKVGRFLRKTSLDELPQIFNILKGDMSIIGPRPALWNQDDLVAERDKYNINSLKPGLTGWAQINGRDELPIPVKVEMDKIYYDNLCFRFDVKCLFLTVKSVIKSDGVVEGGTGQMSDSEISEKLEEIEKV
ncbi:MAG: sugar transferase [Oscillospiraceae bacterium]|nr:sugar transferase [Oscillospiraceae bacterium]